MSDPTWPKVRMSSSMLIRPLPEHHQVVPEDDALVMYASGDLYEEGQKVSLETESYHQICLVMNVRYIQDRDFTWKCSLSVISLVNKKALGRLKF